MNLRAAPGLPTTVSSRCSHLSWRRRTPGAGLIKRLEAGPAAPPTAALLLRRVPGDSAANLTGCKGALPSFPLSAPGFVHLTYFRTESQFCLFFSPRVGGGGGEGELDLPATRRRRYWDRTD